MFRAVTADHVLFDECVDAFRHDGQVPPFMEGDSCSYLLTSFELPEPWQLSQCTVHPSMRIQLPGASAAFVSKVDNPDWVGGHNPHLYGIAVASIVSFATARPCKSTRDDYLCRRDNLTPDDYLQLALAHPILVAGPGCIHVSLSRQRREEFKDSVSSLVSNLYSLPYREYRLMMQAIRLVHLSLLSKRDDFGLAYLLIVSAIESIAQVAIKREKVRQHHPQEANWKTRASQDDQFAELFSAYRELRGRNSYLKERYVAFIEKFCPVETWEQIVAHPLQDVADYVGEISPTHDMSHVVQKHWFEKYPKDLSQTELRQILGDSYTHRSHFIHRGEQPPHRDPVSFNRFFQEFREFDGARMIEGLLPNYELLVGIARRSINAWCETRLGG